MAAELRYAAARKGAERLSRELAAVLGAIDVLPFEAPADIAYGALRADLERQGQLIGPNAMRIAAHARTLGCILVTHHGNELRRVPDLRVANWLQ